MKIAFLSPFFWPEPISTGKYNTILAEALVEQGHKVDFFCSHPFYPEWKPIIEAQAHRSVNVIRGGGFLKYSNSQVIKRLTLELWYLFFIIRNSFKQRRNYDLIISVYPPVFFGFASSLFIPKDKKNVVISHDLQGILANQPGSFFRRSIAKIIRKIEMFVYRRADHIVFLSESMKNFCLENYKINADNTSIYYPFEDISARVATNDLQLFEGNTKRIVYSGALGEKQAPARIINLFDCLTSKDPEFKCFIFSSGPKFNELAENNKNPQIIFNQLVPLCNLRELLEKSCLQLIPQEIGTSDAVLPSKLPNILTAGAGVVAITDKGNELESLLKKVSNSLVFYIWDYEFIAEEILKFVNKKHTNEAIDDNLADLISHFDVKNLISHLEKIGCE